ncbi:MAG: class I SAM-dependent methyltransferase [Steroidobacteraceae bacterium]
MRATSVHRQKPPKLHRPPPTNNFGADYFRRFYLDPKTRVVTGGEMRSRAAVIASLLGHLQIPVRRILDAGCGLGLLRGPLADLYPRARYSGLESSPYLCKRFGWILGSVTDFAPSKQFDLTICYDVLQYLPDAQAARAIANFARLTRAALYVSALTVEDWRDNCDRSRTDRDVHLRSGAWYRRRLLRSFRYMGVGVWLRRNVAATLWDMEQPWA